MLMRAGERRIDVYEYWIKNARFLLEPERKG